MRSALICVFFTLVVQRDGSITVNAEHEDDFQPTPIPLNVWLRDRLETAGTLQEIIKTEAPPTTAVVPAHYWEDALRHSVYLTLVRDKIDQLIAQGDYISPDRKPESQVSKEIDDHDLWDKIKTARFDRLREEPIPPADVTILAKGRLLEDGQGYRFLEDDASQNNCSDSNCAKGKVTAFWSVKRMRQAEKSPGKYHYELTFSVTSQTTKKVKKPYENPVRTFTIKESMPLPYRQIVNPQGKTIFHHDTRPQRAIWVHKNINPVVNYQKRPPSHSRGLDRIFSSLFSDEDSEEVYRNKPKTYLANAYPQHAKGSHADERESYFQKKLLPYPMTNPQPQRYTYPPIAPPPAPYVRHSYFNVDSIANVPYVQPYSDNRYLPSNIIKTTRPAVLPTPIPNHPLLKESTIEVPVKTKLNATDYTTKEPDVGTTYKIYHQQKQKPMKISYVSDHIRPPVYNAPPGIFVTMDKKPFKPMPPLKYSHLNKPLKTVPPDFRPSPQVLDTQFSELDSSADTAFRPITMNFTDISNFKDDDISSKKSNKNTRKTGVTKKPAKKHENIKYTRFTTVSPEIITAGSPTFENSANVDDEMEWANVLGAFTKTTPMASHKEPSTKENIDPITTTTPLSTTTTTEEFHTILEFEDSYEDEIPSTSTTSSTTSTTTTKPKKRTRPPPKFNKTEKIKKHKRVTSTTTTLKPTRKYPLKRLSDDLTPQASSAATSATNSIWETKTHKVPASTTTSSTTARPTTTIELTTITSTSITTIEPSSSTVDTEQPVVTTQPKSKNRFRQSTLMQKGTSVNHDKWSTSTLDKIRTNTATSHVYPLRRKASKFTGYIPTSTPRSPEVQRDKEDHRDRPYNFNKASVSSSTTEKVEEDITVKTTQPTYEKEDVKVELMEWSQDDAEPEEEEEDTNKAEQEHKETTIDAQESKDDHEYIFPTASVIQEVKEYIGLEDHVSTTEPTVVASPYSVTKNKTKCKKKKHNNLTTTKEPFKSSTEPVQPDTSSSTSTTASPVTPDIFNELFLGFTMDDTRETLTTKTTTPAPEQNTSESVKHERYLQLDNADDLEDFLHSLDEKSSNSPHDNDDKLDSEYDDEKDGSPYNIREDSQQFVEDYYEESQENQDEPFSLLELMDVE